MTRTLWKVGEQIQIFGGMTTGTVVSIDRHGVVVIEWDEGDKPVPGRINTAEIEEMLDGGRSDEVIGALATARFADEIAELTETIKALSTESTADDARDAKRWRNRPPPRMQ